MVLRVFAGVFLPDIRLTVYVCVGRLFDVSDCLSGRTCAGMSVCLSVRSVYRCVSGSVVSFVPFHLCAWVYWCQLVRLVVWL